MNIKIKKNSFQIKILFYLISFSIIILLGLWYSQIIYLKVYYEKYQINKIKNVSTKIIRENLTSNDLETLAYNNDICIEYVTNNKAYFFNELNSHCILDINNIGINKILSSFINNDKKEELIKLNNPRDNTKSILYNIKLEDNNYIFLNTTLEDVNSTSSVLKSQLIYITLCVIVLAIIVSIIISKRINKPILNITKEAKKLAKGNKKLTFEKSNIYEIDELAEVLSYASKEINKTDELRRDLLANVSHDLKTPLTMIKAYAEMVRDINKNDETKRTENLNIIIEEADRLNILVNDLLNLSKLEANSESLDITSFDLCELIKNIVKKFNIIKETENYNFIINLPKNAKVLGDINKISQVIYNLVNNAVNYTGEDLKVIIDVIEKKKSYLVNISDTGKGINKSDLKIIWDKYYKNEKNHKRNKIGTGVGLSIVKYILEKHNFIYGVNSEINKGTTFYFEITKNNKNS